MKKLASFILDYPKSVISAMGILIIAALYPASQIDTNFNLENFFPKNAPIISNYNHLEKVFGQDDNIIMVGYKSDSLFSEGVLSDLRAMVDSAKTIPNIKDVESLWSAQNITNDSQSLSFTNYLTNNSLSKTDLSKVKSQLIHDPFAQGLLVNKDANVTAFYLKIASGKNTYISRKDIISKLHHFLEPYHQKYDIKISGIPYYRNQYVQYLNHEMIVYVSIATLLIILLLWGIYRSFTGIAIPILLVWLTILFTLAIMQLTGGYFEVMTSTLAPILLCVGIADSVHMISKYDDSIKQGWSRERSIKEMVTTLGKATFLTSITTAVGFGTLVTSEIVPMKRFGIYTATGVMIAFLVTIMLLPALMTIMKNKVILKKEAEDLFEPVKRLLVRINQFNKRYYKKITVGAFIFSLAMGAGMYQLKVNGKVFDELSEETKPRQNAQFFENNLAPPFPMEFIIDTKQKNGVKKADFVNRLDEFTQYLESQKEVDRATSFNTLIKKMHSVMAPEQAKKNAMPASTPLISQYALLFEMNGGDRLKSIADFEYQKVRIAAQIHDVGSYRVNKLKDQFDQYLSSNFPDAKTSITGSTILSASLNSKIVYSLFKSIGLAFVIISLIMAFLFKNVRMVLISLIPNILPLLVTAGFMGYASIDIKSSTAVIFTIAFGIAVDDSIHYLSRLKVEMQRGKNLYQAIEATTQKTGKPIILTSIILIAGFGSLLTSVFISTVYMGLLVGVTIFTALLADLFLLPSLFYYFSPSLHFGQDTQKDDSKSAQQRDQAVTLHQQ